jgi:hypothetical protein
MVYLGRDFELASAIRFSVELPSVHHNGSVALSDGRSVGCICQSAFRAVMDDRFLRDWDAACLQATKRKNS